MKSLHGGLGTSSTAATKMGDDLDKGSKKGTRALGALKSGAGLAVGALGVAGLAGAMKTAVDEFQEARKVGANTNQVIKSTGGAANVTAKHVAELASSISKKVGMDDEAIQSGSNLLLTFKNIRNETGKGRDIFDQATKAAVDLSAAGFGSLSSTSKQLGKALNDPVKGMTALGRAGVTFSADQKKAIEALLATGKAADRVKAQQIILKEVQSQVGGQAAAQATTMDKLKVTLGNLAEAGGSVLVPALDKIGKFLVLVINQMIEGKGVGGAIVSTFKTVGGAMGDVIAVGAGLVAFFKENKTLTLALAAAVGVFALAYTATLIPALVLATAMILSNVAAWVALKVAFLASPIGLVVIAIAALAAGLVIAYRESETFRGIVDAVWSVVKKAAGVVWDIAKVAIPAFIGAIVSAGTAVWDFLTNLDLIPGKIVDAGNAIVNGIVDGIKALPGLLADAATWLWDQFKAGVEAYAEAYKTVGGWVLNRIVDGFKIIGTLLASVGGWLLNRFTDLIKLEIEGAKAIGGWILNRIVDGFKAVTDLLSSVGGWLKNRFVEIVHLAIEGFTGLGSWILNRVVDGFMVVTDALGSVGGWLKNRLVEIFDGVKDKIVSIGGTIIGWIVDGLKGGLNLLIDFVNSIIDVINKIPGVEIKSIPHVKLAEGGTTADKAQALAQGGIVRKPIVMMGEEAPRHPEYVIPTNPAYRGRAKMLLGQAASAIGYAKGGKYDKDYGRGSQVTIPFEAAAMLAEAAGLPGITYAQIAIGESALKPGAVSNDGGFGLWQMTPRVQSAETVGKWNAIGSYFNPWNNAQMAKVLDNVSNYYGTSSVTDWNKHYTGSVAGYEPSPNGLSLPNPLDLIKKLPGIGDLPDWLQGTGKWIIDKASDYIKGALGGVLGGKVPGWGALDSLAQKHGLSITDTYRPGGDTYHGMLMGPGGRARATDYSNGFGPTKEMMEVAQAMRAKYGSQLKELFYSPMGGSIKDGKWVPGMIVGGPLGTPGNHYNHVHAAFAQGGRYGGGAPFVGSYRDGGRVPADGLGYLHRGETVIPNGGGGGPLVHIEHMDVHRDTDVERVARSLAWRIATGTP